MFWTSGDVCPGFQSQSGSLFVCFLACVSLRFISGVTPAGYTEVSKAAEPFQSTHLQTYPQELVEVWAQTHDCLCVEHSAAGSAYEKEVSILAPLLLSSFDLLFLLKVHSLLVAYSMTPSWWHQYKHLKLLCGLSSFVDIHPLVWETFRSTATGEDWRGGLSNKTVCAVTPETGVSNRIATCS